MTSTAGGRRIRRGAPRRASRRCRVERCRSAGSSSADSGEIDGTAGSDRNPERLTTPRPDSEHDVVDAPRTAASKSPSTSRRAPAGSPPQRVRDPAVVGPASRQSAVTRIGAPGSRAPGALPTGSRAGAARSRGWPRDDRARRCRRLRPRGRQVENAADQAPARFGSRFPVCDIYILEPTGIQGCGATPSRRPLSRGPVVRPSQPYVERAVLAADDAVADVAGDRRRVRAPPDRRSHRRRPTGPRITSPRPTRSRAALSRWRSSRGRG